MDLYNHTSLDISKLLTKRYSSSFSASSLLFAKSIRPHIYSIYGLVRVADEIVDTYAGSDQDELLDQLEAEVYDSMARGYSSNPLVHSFAKTADIYHIDKSLIHPFFDSMRTDVDPPQTFTDQAYRRYIYGSAEVVGLMCLKVFASGNKDTYNQLQTGASHLGAAYQKVNFLRDVADDYNRLNRTYFPGLDYESFDDQAKRQIEDDIERDFRIALPAIKKLPKSSRKAVLASFQVYYRLLVILRKSSAENLKQQRLRVPTLQKLALITRTYVGIGL